MGKGGTGYARERRTAADEVTDETRLTVVKLLAGGRDADWVAGVVKLNRDQVVEVASAYGWPNPDSMGRAAEVLQRNLDRQRAGAPTLHRTPARDAKPAAPPAAARVTPAARPVATAPAAPASANDHQAAPSLGDRDRRLATREPPPAPAANGARVDAALVAVAMVDAHPSNVGRNLGDLRDLVASIEQRGVLVPISVERRGQRYRLRDGRRRLAAARLAKVTRVPAVIHAEQLDEREWLLEAVEYNVRRRGYSDEEQRQVAGRLQELGVAKGAIAEAFGMSWSRLSRVLDPPAAQKARSEVARVSPVVSRKVLRELLTYAEDQGYSASPVLIMLAALVDGLPWRSVDEATEAAAADDDGGPS